MARAISINDNASTIYGFTPTREITIGDDGFPMPNIIIAAPGKVSDNKARLLLEKEVKTKNVMLVRVEFDETKLSLSAEDFIINSRRVLNGESFGHDSIVREFKITEFAGWYMDEHGFHNFTDEFPGTTTTNKLLNYARDLFGPTATINPDSVNVTTEKRVMTRAKYSEIAK